MTHEDRACEKRVREKLRVKDDYLADVLARKRRLLFDGGMGTMVQRGNLVAPGELPDLLNLDNPEAVTAIHAAYVEAGSLAVTTNTFGANRLKLGEVASVADVYAAGVACARASGARYVAADMGPLGVLLSPLGLMGFDEAYELFAEEARAAQAAGADLIIIETMADLKEIRAAAGAALDETDLPVFASMTFSEHGRTLMGDKPADVARALDELGVNALGINCSLGPADLEPLAREMLAATSKPVIVQANAGLPELIGDETVYSIGPEEYAVAVRSMADAGVSIIGGCCGTDPDFIRELTAFVR